MSEDRKAQSLRFWQLPIQREGAWIRKYAALEELAAEDEDDARKSKMRSIARIWPGALREAELFAPEVIAQRRAVCAHPPVGKERRVWRAGFGCLLACELNARIADYQKMRESARKGGSPWDLARGLASLGADRRSSWPSPLGPGLSSHPPSPRVAYLGLAWSSGLSLPSLNRLIFEREGHWDRRESDPGWAHQSGPMEWLLEDVR